jgi:Fic family protein
MPEQSGNMSAGRSSSSIVTGGNIVFEEETHTSVRVRGGGLEIRDAGETGGFDFAEASVEPVRTDPRYCINLRTLGRLERLAKARFLIAEKNPGFDPAILNPDDLETARSIALSVYASSEIEGEGVAADHLEAFVAALTLPRDYVDSELYLRADAYRNIKDTYFWALNSTSDPVLSYDFVMETHRRMFRKSDRTRPGQIKDREVHIQWRRPNDGHFVKVPTISPDRAEPFLRSLCERTSKMFRLAQESAEASMFLVAAEFACDFLAIHPFIDGNGRTARLLSTYLLERGGYHFSRVYPLDQVVLDSRADYYEALNQSQRFWHMPNEDLTPWVEYFVRVVFEQWERAFRRIRDKAASR